MRRGVVSRSLTRISAADGGSLRGASADPRPQPAREKAGDGVIGPSAPHHAAPAQGAVNNRLTPGVPGARRPREARLQAFDQLPERVANAIRDSRSGLCPVAALRLVKRSGCTPEQIARFLEQHAAWTDWRVLAADFGAEGASRLRPDAPKRKPKLGRAPSPAVSTNAKRNRKAAGA